MNIIAVVSNGWAALKYGSELKHAAGWKKVQTVTNTLAAGVALAAALGYPIPLGGSEISIIAAAIVHLANAYLTVATTSKIGLPGASSGSNPPQLPLVELIGQPQGHNDASQDVGETPVYQLGRPGTDVAPQNPVIHRSVAGAERGNSASDGLRQPVQAVDYPIGGADDTYPNMAPLGFGDRD